MNVEKEKIGRVLFHITPLKNLSRILEKGLEVNSSNNGFVPKSAIKNYYKKYGMQPVFLTTNPVDVYKTQLTESYVKNNKCVILKIDAVDLEDEYAYLKQNPSPYRTYKDVLNSNIVLNRDFISRNNIEPNRIEVFSCAMAFFFFGQIRENVNTSHISSICG